MTNHIPKSSVKRSKRCRDVPTKIASIYLYRVAWKSVLFVARVQDINNLFRRLHILERMFVLTPYLRGSLRLDLLDECIWLLPWLRNAICFEIGFVLNLSSRSKGCSMTNHCSRITAWIFCRDLNFVCVSDEFIKILLKFFYSGRFIYRIILECDSF